MHYTNEDVMRAKDVNLVDLAESMGYTPVRIGHFFTLKEHDSVRIHNQLTYHRFSTGTGGDAISFVKEFGNMGFQDAVKLILDFKGEHPQQSINFKKEEIAVPKQMILPEKADQYKRLFAYLIKTRKLSPDLVQWAVKNHLMYESKDHHNIVFLSRDKDGIVRHAFQRGTNDQVTFKGDVPGNDKRYGFNIIGKNDTLYVYESAIDCLSDLDMSRNFQPHRLALGGLSDGPLETFLQEHPSITDISFRLDNDTHGREAAEELSMKYTSLGYNTRIDPPIFPAGIHGKDYNELLQIVRKESPQPMMAAPAR